MTCIKKTLGIVGKKCQACTQKYDSQIPTNQSFSEFLAHAKVLQSIPKLKKILSMCHNLYGHELSEVMVICQDMEKIDMSNLVNCNKTTAIKPYQNHEYIVDFLSKIGKSCVKVSKQEKFWGKTLEEYVSE